MPTMARMSVILVCLVFTTVFAGISVVAAEVMP